MPIFSPETTSSGYKIACGRHTTVAATDTVATGLANVVAVVVSFESSASDSAYAVTAAPSTAGNIIVKQWKTDGSDPTPVAATSFSAIVNWIAVGY